MKKLLIMMAFATMTSGVSAQQVRSGINLNDLDTSVRPADDF